MPMLRAIIFCVAGVLIGITNVSESRCGDGPPATDPSPSEIADELWKNRLMATRCFRSGLRDRLLLCERGRCVVVEASGRSHITVGNGWIWDAAVLGGETTTLVQTGPKQLEISHGKQTDKAQSLTPQFQNIIINGAVLDPSRRRILTISLDHVESTYLDRNDVYGPGSLQLISMDGSVLCAGFDFPEVPHLIRRDETCTRVAVLTERRVYLFKVDLRGFDLVGCSEEFKTTPNAFDFSRDGNWLLVGGYDWVKCLASENLKTLWTRNCPSEIGPVVCTEKFCAWRTKNRIDVKLIATDHDDVRSIDVGDDCYGICSVYSRFENVIAAVFVPDPEARPWVKIYNAETLAETTAFTFPMADAKGQ